MHGNLANITTGSASASDEVQLCRSLVQLCRARIKRSAFWVKRFLLHFNQIESILSTFFIYGQNFATLTKNLVILKRVATPEHCFRAQCEFSLTEIRVIPWTLFIWHKVSWKIVGLSYPCLDRTFSTLDPCLHENIQRRNFSLQSLAKFVLLLHSYYFIKGIYDEFYAFGYSSPAILMFVSLVCCNYFLKEILIGFCLWILQSRNILRTWVTVSKHGKPFLKTKHEKFLTEGLLDFVLLVRSYYCILDEKLLTVFVCGH